MTTKARGLLVLSSQVCKLVEMLTLLASMGLKASLIALLKLVVRTTMNLPEPGFVLSVVVEL
jgi:hypothetical protein